MLPRLLRLDVPISAQHSAVFQTLLEANASLGNCTTLRVAGGWVRDTLLGVHSNDIDIAIETAPGQSVVSGERFAQEVAHVQAASSESPERTVSVIRVNPDLSKHIETATVCVHDIPVEFCALRADDYTSKSRIPTVRPATPLEDALRRDFTINALFYNLHTNFVEDYTTGLEDLELKRIRCPLAPKDTFADDPLRLLRGVRFAGQLGDLGFFLDNSVCNAVDDSILDILQAKVSRERVGKEFVKMARSPHPQNCLDHLLSMQLLSKILLVEVFIPPSKKKQSQPCHPVRVTRLLEGSISEIVVIKYWKAVIKCVVPLFGKQYSVFSIPEDARVVPLIFVLTILFYREAEAENLEDRLCSLCINGLKLSNSQCQGVRRMVEAYRSLLNSHLMLSELQGKAIEVETKEKIFDALSFLNDLSVVPDSFKVVLLMFCLVEWHQEQFLANVFTPESVQEFIEVLWKPLQQSPSLLFAFSATLPLKGNDVRECVNISTREIGSALMELRRQLAFYPQSVGTTEQAVEWLRSCYPPR